MENRQRTPLALAIEEIEKDSKIRKVMSEYQEGYYYGIENALRILRNLKPKEREMIESMYVKGTRAEFYDATEESCKVVFDLTLTQE